MCVNNFAFSVKTEHKKTTIYRKVMEQRNKLKQVMQNRHTYTFCSILYMTHMITEEERETPFCESIQKSFRKHYTFKKNAGKQTLIPQSKALDS